MVSDLEDLNFVEDIDMDDLEAIDMEVLTGATTVERGYDEK